KDSSNVTAVGEGASGNGIAVTVAGGVEIEAGATVTSVAHGDGSSFYLENGDVENNSTKTTAVADNGNYFDTNSGVSTGSESITTKLNKVPSSGGGGCDAGFGIFGLIAALGAVSLGKKKF
ncbi:MAG: hypothetical protein LBR87_02930, partial [Synergistaceae bacterium]|nr:hypothetical protein [Synergistaceae bacterium]